MLKKAASCVAKVGKCIVNEIGPYRKNRMVLWLKQMNDALGN